MKFSVKQHKQPSENTYTHSALVFPFPLIPPCVDCTGCHQQLFSLRLWPQYWVNQSGNIRWRTHIPLLQGHWTVDAIVEHHVRFIVCLPVIVAVISIIQVTIAVKPIFGVRNGFRCTMFITFCWIVVNAVGLAHIQYMSSSSREVLCSQNWWHRWSSWQCKCSWTMMLKVRLRCLEDPISIRDVS